MNTQVRGVKNNGKQRQSMNKNAITMLLIHMPILEV